MKKNIIRISDTIRIVKPDMFIRCGYELTPDIAVLHVQENHRDLIVDFIREFNGTKGLLDLYTDNTKYSLLYLKIVDLLSYEYIRNHLKDGIPRSLYTRWSEMYEGWKGEVVDIKYVRTGTYHKGYICNRHWDEEPDYMHAYLDNIETHKILYLGNEYYRDMIEDINVEKVNL